MTLAARHSAETSPGLALWRATLAWQARQRAVLKPHGLTHVQFVLLASLVNAAEPPTQIELARTVGLDAMMSSQVLRALEGMGLVNRQRSAQDARTILVTATLAGVKTANAAVFDVEGVDHEFFAPAGDSEHLARLLRSLVEPKCLPDSSTLRGSLTQQHDEECREHERGRRR